MAAAIIIVGLAVAVLVEALIMARQEVIRLRAILDQWEQEDAAESTDERWATGWAKIK